MLGELAEGGDLAAEDRQQRRLPVWRVELENIVARHRARVVGVVVVERPDAGEAVHDIVAGELALEVAVDHLEQIVDLAGVGGDVLGPPFIGNVGRADQREIVLVGIDEDHALVAVLDEIGLPALPEFRHDDVAALDQADVARRVQPGHAADHVIDPGAGGIDQRARPDASS